MTVSFSSKPLRLVAISGSTRRPSKSRALAAALAAKVAEQVPVELAQYDIIDAGRGLGAAFVRSELPPEALAIVEAIESADGLIAVTPVYKGSYSGMFKHLFDFLEPLALLDKPVLIGATGGGYRHALMVEHQMRPLFGFFSAATAPTSVYVSDSEFADGEPADPTILSRIDMAAQQFAALLLQRLDAAAAPRAELTTAP